MIAGVARAAARGKAAELLDRVGLGRAPDAPAGAALGRRAAARRDRPRARQRPARSCSADEPTGNLDHTTADERHRRRCSTSSARTGLAALIATHNLELARRLDRIVALEDGQASCRRLERPGSLSREHSMTHLRRTAGSPTAPRRRPIAIMPATRLRRRRSSPIISVNISARRKPMPTRMTRRRRPYVRSPVLPDSRRPVPTAVQPESQNDILTREPDGFWRFAMSLTLDRDLESFRSSNSSFFCD